jgi:hypothetical protein
MMQRIRSWADPMAGGWYLLDVAVAAVLSIIGILMVTGTIGASHTDHGPAAAVGVLAMTVPVAWRRQAPLSAAAALAAGAVLNGVLFGSIVRCGVALPAVFLVAVALGARREQTWWALGLGLCSVNVVTQAFYDPQLGPEVLPYMLPILFAFFGLGLVMRSWTLATDALQRQSELLRRQRDETARISVAADRARLSEELDAAVRGRIDRIAAEADGGIETARHDLPGTVAALRRIEDEGREVLRQMREIVGTLDPVAPSAPAPTLAEVPALLGRATTADARLRIEGVPRRLPAGLELSGYRIVEHLLSAVDTAPHVRVDVLLSFGAESLEVRVTGPATGGANLDSALAAAGERAALYQGMIEDRTDDGLCQMSARLPLVSTYA